jgi:putative ATPase
LAINKDISSIKNGEILDIPNNIKHNYGGFVKQKYLSKNLKFINLNDIGYEAKMKKWLENINI